MGGGGGVPVEVGLDVRDGLERVSVEAVDTVVAVVAVVSVVAVVAV